MPMKHNHIRLILALLAGGSTLFGVPGWSQEQKAKQQKPAAQAAAQEQEEYTEEEYDAYEKATKEPDLDKRATMLLAFLEKHPKSKLKSYIVTAYQMLMYEHQKGQRYAKLLPLAEEWLKYYPDDLQIVAYIAESALMLGQHRKFIEYGQKIYAKNPDCKFASYLYNSYEKIGDKAKTLEWTEKLLACPEFNDNPDLRMVFVKKYADEKKFDRSAEYAHQALKSLQIAKKPDSKSEAEWQNTVAETRSSCNYIIGLNHYQLNRYTEAIKSLESALSDNKKLGDTGYYYIGLSLWKLDRIDEANITFAKAVLLKGETGAQAKEHLEKIYKALHNNTLIGIDKVYNKAKAQLEGRDEP